MPEAPTPEWLVDVSRQLGEETAQRLFAMLERARGTQPVSRIRNSQLASALIGTIGLALFIVGVENAASDIPVLSNAYGSIFVGLAILAITGLLLQVLGRHAA
jgi:hypothetical protein